MTLWYTWRPSPVGEHICVYASLPQSVPRLPQISSGRPGPSPELHGGHSCHPFHVLTITVAGDKYLWSPHLGCDLNARVAQVLAKHLHRVIALTHISFDDSGMTLALNDALPTAFAALSKINHVTAHSAGERTRRMFEEMQWPLKSAVLNTGCPGDDSWDYGGSGMGRRTR